MATAADGPVMLVYAAFSLAAGLAIMLGHNVWSGGTLPVIVTLVGWLIFAKGLVLLLVTPETWALLLERIRYTEHSSLYYYTGFNYRPLLDLRRFLSSVPASQIQIISCDIVCLYSRSPMSPYGP